MPGQLQWPAGKSRWHSNLLLLPQWPLWLTWTGSQQPYAPFLAEPVVNQVNNHTVWSLIKNPTDGCQYFFFFFLYFTWLSKKVAIRSKFLSCMAMVSTCSWKQDPGKKQPIHKFSTHLHSFCETVLMFSVLLLSLLKCLFLACTDLWILGQGHIHD